MTKKCFFIGLDVHKERTTYVVRDWNGKIVVEGECATNFKDVFGVLEPYLHCCKVGVEACTSFYHLYKGFKSKNIDILVANVIQLRRLIGKNDKLDARRLSDMLRLNTFPRSFIPGEIIQHLRTLVSLRHRFVKECTRLKNQIHAILDREGVKIPVRTKFCKKWCTHLQQYIIQSDSLELHYLYEAQQSTGRRTEQISLQIISYTKKHFEKELKLLTSIPGIGEIFGSYVISQVLPISRFANKKKLRRYAGVIPVTDKSDTQEYGTYLPKTTSRTMLRYVLVEAAHGAIKTKSRLTAYYKKKKKGHTTTHALMCVASTISDIVFTVLTTGRPYEM